MYESFYCMLYKSSHCVQHEEGRYLPWNITSECHFPSRSDGGYFGGFTHEALWLRQMVENNCSITERSVLDLKKKELVSCRESVRWKTSLHLC